LLNFAVLQMFFGIVRQSCGGDDHPSANQFLYVYRLLSVSSLVKPGRRASVQGNPVEILMSMQAVKSQEQRLPFVPQIEELLDDILQHETAESICQSMLTTEHAYNKSTPEDCITFYLGGYVAHKLQKFTTCDVCCSTLTNLDNVSSDAKLIELKTRGGLKLPSPSLTVLIRLLESCVQKYSATPNTNMYFDILNDTLTSDELPTAGIGCESHSTALTARCIHFYISTRLHFLEKSVNRNRSSWQAKHKLSKIAKLT
jgi:hypothetical protein